MHPHKRRRTAALPDAVRVTPLCLPATRALHTRAVTAAVFLRGKLPLEIYHEILCLAWPLMCFRNKVDKATKQRRLRMGSEWNNPARGTADGPGGRPPPFGWESTKLEATVLRRVLPRWCFSRCYGCSAHFTTAFAFENHRLRWACPVKCTPACWQYFLHNKVVFTNSKWGFY